MSKSNMVAELDAHIEEMEREQAIEQGAVAIGVSQEYGARLAVTARIHSGTYYFRASDDEAAAKHVEGLKWRDFSFEYSMDDGVEGDEIAWWWLEDNPDAEVEIVLKEDGEPFSWTACEIVKELAQIEDLQPGHADLQALIDRAKASLLK